jgi:hypothetical protein
VERIPQHLALSLLKWLCAALAVAVVAVDIHLRLTTLWAALAAVAVHIFKRFFPYLN